MQRRGETIELTAARRELLEMLLRESADRRLAARRRSSRSGAAAAVENVVDRYVARLRRKLGDPLLIRTVWGVGFILEA